MSDRRQGRRAARTGHRRPRDRRGRGQRHPQRGARLSGGDRPLRGARAAAALPPARAEPAARALHHQRVGMSRRTTWRKAGGRPLRRNDRRRAPDDIWTREQPEVRLERWAPGPGARHLLTLAQLRDFLGLLPEWDTVVEGLDAIVLDGRERGLMGWCYPGVIGLCAWRRRLWWTHPSP